MDMHRIRNLLLLHILISLALELKAVQCYTASEAFKREPGHPHWHHGAFHDVSASIRSEIPRLLHTRAEVPFQVPLEVNVVLIGFNGEGGYRFSLDSHRLEEFLRISFPSHRPHCLETGEPLGIEHHVVYNVLPVGQQEVIILEKALKQTMVPAGTAREIEFGMEVPVFEVEATSVEPVFQKLFSYIFDNNDAEYSTVENDIPSPNAIFVINFDKARMDPRNKEVDLDNLMHGEVGQLSDEEISKQEGGYIYRYRYDGGGATQVWLSSDRFVVIDLSAGPCTYGKIETEEGTVNSRALPRIRNMIYRRGVEGSIGRSTSEIFVGQLSALIASAVEHVIAPDVRFETVDVTTRLLIPIIVLRNHNKYDIMEKGWSYSINVEEIESEVKKMVHDEQQVVVIGGSHSLHHHEKLAVAVSKAMRGHSLQETRNDGRFHVRTKTYLDGAILKEEMERSADILAAGLLEMADPSLSTSFFLRQHQADEFDNSGDSVLEHKPLWDSHHSKSTHETHKKKRTESKRGELQRTYGTRVVPVFVLSLSDVDSELTMKDESLVWTSNDVVIVLQHQTEKIPLSYVSETERRHAFPSQAQRHIVAGLASTVGGLSAPYTKASPVHERATINWLWAAGCHPFGPFSNSSRISRVLQAVALRNAIYARVDSALNRIHETSEAVQAFAAEYLKTPLGEPLKDRKETVAELWLDKFYRKSTKMPEPFPHELVERLEKFLQEIEEKLVDISALLYDHRLHEAHWNSTGILQISIFTERYVDHVLAMERQKMSCCSIQHMHHHHNPLRAYIYGVILLAGGLCFFCYSFLL